MDYVMTTQSPDRVGIVAALTGCLNDHGGFITELAQFGTPESERFVSRIAFRVDDIAPFRAAIADISTRMGLRTAITRADARPRAAILVSKFDHCLADLLYRRDADGLSVDIVGVVSNHPDARARAETADLPFVHVPVSKSTKPRAEAALRDALTAWKVELVILARYMQILSADFCADHAGRIINIHHSFLPSFKGARPYHQAYARGVKLIGASAHYVTDDLDEGPIIAQSVAPVDHTHTPARLIALGRDLEAQTLARAVNLHGQRRAFIDGAKTVVLP